KCAPLFVGEHDWTAFSSAQSDSETKLRSITALTIAARWDERAHCQLIEILVSAEGFLRYMVRSIAGTLMAVGRGEMDDTAIKRAIDAGDRSLAGATAPANGLTLVSVRYE